MYGTIFNVELSGGSTNTADTTLLIGFLRKRPVLRHSIRQKRLEWPPATRLQRPQRPLLERQQQWRDGRQRPPVHKKHKGKTDQSQTTAGM